MKAIILDYMDGSVLLVTIPKDWEEDPETFVRNLPAYDDSVCNYMIAKDGFEVYDIVEDGKDEDGCPTYDYQHRLTL